MKVNLQKNNFLKGFLNCFNVFPTPIKNPIVNKSVCELIANDWRAVDKDIREAVKEVIGEKR